MKVRKLHPNVSSTNHIIAFINCIYIYIKYINHTFLFFFLKFLLYINHFLSACFLNLTMFRFLQSQIFVLIVICFFTYSSTLKVIIIFLFFIFRYLLFCCFCRLLFLTMYEVADRRNMRFMWRWSYMSNMSCKWKYTTQM